MSSLDISDLTSDTLFRSNNGSTYIKLQHFLSELEKKEQDLHDQHQRLLSDFQKTKTTIIGLSNSTKNVQDKTMQLSKSYSYLNFSSDNELENEISKFTRKCHSVDLKIMRIDQLILEQESKIIQTRAEKLNTNSILHQVSNRLDNFTNQFDSKKEEIIRIMKQIHKDESNIKKTCSFFKRCRNDFLNSIQTNKSNLHMNRRYRQNICIQGKNMQNKIEEVYSNLIKTKKKIEYQNLKNDQKFEQTNLINNHLIEKIIQIRNKKLMYDTEIKSQKVENKETNQVFHSLQMKLQGIEDEILYQQNIYDEICLKIQKYGNQVEKKNEQIHTIFSSLKRDLLNINIQIEKAKSIGNGVAGCQQQMEANSCDKERCNSVKTVRQINNKAISELEEQLRETKEEILVFKSQINSVKKHLLESSIEYSELEQKAADLLIASVNKEKSILLRQDKRNDAHEQFILDALISIQQMKGRIAVCKSKIGYTSCQNKCASELLDHVTSCCNMKEYRNGCVVVPNRYIYVRT